MNRKKRNGLPDRTPAQVAKMKALKLTSRYVHISCAVKMIPRDIGGGVIQHFPWVEKPGHTYRRQNAA